MLSGAVMPSFEQLFRRYFDDALSLAHNSAFKAVASGTVEPNFGPEITRLMNLYRDTFISAVLSEKIDHDTLQSIVFSTLALIDIASKACVRDPTLAVGILQLDADLKEQRRKQLSAMGNAARREKYALIRNSVERCAKSIRAKNKKLSANAIAGSTEMRLAIESAAREGGGGMDLPAHKTVSAWVHAILSPTGRRTKNSGTGGP